MNIAVIGAGGVGGYFGGKLTKLLEDSNDINLYFIARGDHLKEIKKNGLLLDTEQEQIICNPTLTSDNINELPFLDLCLLSVKEYDLNQILFQLKSKITDTTVILPLLNGIDIYQRIREVIKKGIVLPACVYVGTHIERPGKVKQRGGSCTIHFGKDPNFDYINDYIFKLLEKADIKYKWYQNPYQEIWNKYIFIASFGLVTAAYNKSIGEVLKRKELLKLVKGIMKEITILAKNKEIPIPETIIEDSIKKAASFPFETKTSFQRDYENKEKKDERDLFAGSIIRMGEELNIKTENTIMINDILEN